MSKSVEELGFLSKLIPDSQSLKETYKTLGVFHIVKALDYEQNGSALELIEKEDDSEVYFGQVDSKKLKQGIGRLHWKSQGALLEG
jgi:hypothetical protein